MSFELLIGLFKDVHDAILHHEVRFLHHRYRCRKQNDIVETTPRRSSLAHDHKKFCGKERRIRGTLFASRTVD